MNEKIECLYFAAIATYWMQFQAYNACLKVPECCLHFLTAYINAWSKADDNVT